MSLILTCKLSTNSFRLQSTSSLKASAHIVDDYITSAEATSGRKKHFWKNVPSWSPLNRKIQQHFNTPLRDSMADAGTDSLGPTPIDVKPLPPKSRALVDEPANTLQEIPQRPIVTSKDEEYHLEDGKTPLFNQ